MVGNVQWKQIMIHIQTTHIISDNDDGEIHYFDMTEHNKEWERLYGDQPLIVQTPGLVTWGQDQCTPKSEIPVIIKKE